MVRLQKPAESASRVDKRNKRPTAPPDRPVWIMPRGRRRPVPQDLLNYCERDTWAMVKVVQRLRELAG